MRLVFFELLEVVLLCALILVVTTQIVQPAIGGRQLFPFFRRERRIKQQIAAAEQAAHEDELKGLVRKPKKEKK
jgi:hypothetical protein